jgi:CBS domain-containing protein
MARLSLVRTGTMPVSHTNRKGVTYYLHRGETKTGKVRYFFAPRLHDHPIAEIPAGYSISEGVNGVVSLVKDRPQIITAEEHATVEEALRTLPLAHKYRVVVKDKLITVFELVGQDAFQVADEVAEMSGLPVDTAFVADVASFLQSSGRYAAILRFILTDRASRRFAVERWCYRSSVDGWLELGHGSLERLVRGTIPKLDTDAFFELYRYSLWQP